MRFAFIAKHRSVRPRFILPAQVGYETGCLASSYISAIASKARRQYLIGSTTSLTADQARTEARRILSAAVLGQDHAQARYDTRRTSRFDALVDVDRFCLTDV